MAMIMAALGSTLSDRLSYLTLYHLINIQHTDPQNEVFIDASHTIKIFERETIIL